MIQLSFPKKTVYARNELDQTVKDINNLGINRPLILLSKRTENTPQVKVFLKALEDSNISFSISNNTDNEAPDRLVNIISSDYIDSKSDSFIAIGGGSTIDLAKAASVEVTHGDIEKFLGVDNIPGPTPKKIFIPTTSGTGSESSNIAILGNKANKSKKGMVSNYLFADLIILDPTLTYTMNIDLALATGLDAFCQCLESFTSKTSTRLIQPIAKEGMKLISENLFSALDGDEDSKDNMALGAYYSGIAISGGNSGTNLGHAIGNTIGGIFGSPHGISVTSVLKATIEFNIQDKKYKDKLNKLESELSIDIFDFIDKIDRSFGVPGLEKLNIQETDFDLIADTVLRDQKRLLANNPIQPTKEDLISILNKSK